MNTKKKPYIKQCIYLYMEAQAVIAMSCIYMTRYVYMYVPWLMY